VSIGQRPFTICTKCDIPHYDNCEDCYGFGVRPWPDGPVKHVPVSAGAAIEGEAPADAIPCPTCGSTTKGVPK
jgi:hypothetical protein